MGGSISKKNEHEEDVPMRGGASVGGGGGEGQRRQLQPDTCVISREGVRNIPTVFRWEHGGNQVYLTGTFTNWTRKIPLHRSGNDFLTIQSVPAAMQGFKFVVDDEWRFAPELATVKDIEGNINNIIDLTNFNLDEEKEDDTIFPGVSPLKAAATLNRRDSLGDPTPYGHQVPEDDSYYAKEPPNLPPHLRHIILNLPSPDTERPRGVLSKPLHVTLNHLCA